MTPEEFYQQLSQQGFDLSDKQKQQFETYFHLLVEWNQKINLTAITEKEDVYLKHFYDSVAPVLQGNITNQAIRLLDIGAENVIAQKAFYFVTYHFENGFKIGIICLVKRHWKCLIIVVNMRPFGCLTVKGE